MTPADFLLSMLLREAPLEKPKIEEWRTEITGAVELDRKVAESGALESPEVDRAVLDAIRWYEARLRSHPKDGDCHFVRKGMSGPWSTVCNAIGPLQVRMTAFRAVVGTPEGKAAGIPMSLVKPTVEDIRDPEMGVRVGYAAIIRYKTLCKGNLATWITAFGWGKCPPPHTVDDEGVRRCELVTILLESRGVLPGFWKCGHEGRRIRDAHDARFLRWAREQAKESDPRPVGQNP